MSWADSAIVALRGGFHAKVRPTGNSMTPRIKSGEIVRLVPSEGVELKRKDVVLCSVGSRVYLHKIIAIQGDRVLIGNNHGHVNGWTTRDKIYGIAVL